MKYLFVSFLFIGEVILAKKITPFEYISCAVQNHSESLKEGIINSNADKKISEQFWIPQVSTGYESRNSNFVGNNNQSLDQSNYFATIDQEILNMSRNKIAESRNFELLEAQYSWMRQLKIIAFESIENLQNYLSLDQLLQTKKIEYQLSETAKNLTKDLSKIKVIDASDYLLAELEYLSLKNEVISIENRLQESYKVIKSFLPQETDFEITNNPEPMLEKSSISIQNFSELVQLNNSILKNKFLKESIDWDIAPKVNIGASYRQFTATIPGTNQDKELALQGTLTIPLYERTRSHNSARSLSLINQTKESYRVLIHKLENEIDNLYIRYKALKIQQEILKEKKLVAQKAVDLAIYKLKLGRIDYIQYQNISRQFSITNTDLQNINIEFNIIALRLKFHYNFSQKIEDFKNLVKMQNCNFK